MSASHRLRAPFFGVIVASVGAWLMCISLVGCGSFQAAPSGTRVLAAGDVDSTIESGLFVIQALVNGSHPVRLVLDTGADATVLTPAAIERIGLETEPMMRVVRGAKGGGLEGSKTRISTLDMGGVLLTDFDALVLGLDPIQGSLERAIDGVVGWPAFRNAALRVDIGTGQITVDGTPDGREVTYPLTSRRATIKAPIFGRSTEILVDTGYTGTLAVRRSDLRGLPLQDLGKQRVAGAYRTGTERRVRVEAESEFGGTRIPGAEVFVTDGTRVMGNSWMRNFRVTFDQPSGEIRFFDAKRENESAASR